jgi:DNA-binding YbaB/EbfC family protein
MGIDPRKLQKQMLGALAQAQQVQQQVAEETVEASAGGGLVTVKANGAGEILEIRIDPKAIDPDDPELLADTVLAAVNEALRSARQLVESRMGGLMGGLGLPGLE